MHGSSLDLFSTALRGRYPMCTGTPSRASRCPSPTLKESSFSSPGLEMPGNGCRILAGRQHRTAHLISVRVNYIPGTGQRLVTITVCLPSPRWGLHGQHAGDARDVRGGKITHEIAAGTAFAPQTLDFGSNSFGSLGRSRAPLFCVVPGIAGEPQSLLHHQSVVQEP